MLSFVQLETIENGQIAISFLLLTFNECLHRMDAIFIAMSCVNSQHRPFCQRSRMETEQRRSDVSVGRCENMDKSAVLSGMKARSKCTHRRKECDKARNRPLIESLNHYVDDNNNATESYAIKAIVYSKQYTNQQHKLHSSLQIGRLISILSNIFTTIDECDAMEWSITTIKRTSTTTKSDPKEKK